MDLKLGMKKMSLGDKEDYTAKFQSLRQTLLGICEKLYASFVSVTPVDFVVAYTLTPFRDNFMTLIELGDDYELSLEVINDDMYVNMLDLDDELEKISKDIKELPPTLAPNIVNISRMTSITNALISISIKINIFKGI